MSTSPTDEEAWRALTAHAATMRDVHLRTLFADDPERARRLSFRLDDLLFDFSKHRVTDETMEALMALARQRDLPAWIERMFTGEKINVTEGRAVLHVALRNRDNRPIRVDGKNVVPVVSAVLAKMRKFTDRVRAGEHTGHTGEAITDVVNLGIGGSDLGPLMVCEALEPYWKEGLTPHFEIGRAHV